MKRLLFVLLMAVTFAACEGPTGPPGSDGVDGGEWDEDAFTVRAQDWEPVGIPGTNNFYYAHQRDWDVLDDMAVERGIVVGYVEDYTIGGYTTLPHVYHDKNGYEWTETTSLSFYRGGFEIQVTFSDFSNETPPGEKSFRIIIFK